MRSMTWLALMILLACSPKVDATAANAAEAAQYQDELTACRDAAKADAGPYEPCAKAVDAKHGVKP